MGEPYFTKISEAPSRGLNLDRGKSVMLINDKTGAANVDVHINHINVDSGPGERHYHAKAENVYIVLEGCLEVVVEGNRYLLYKDDVGFIPAGVVHTAGNAGTDGVCNVIEVSAPAGHDFHVVDDWKRRS